MMKPHVTYFSNNALKIVMKYLPKHLLKIQYLQTQKFPNLMKQKTFVESKYKSPVHFNIQYQLTQRQTTTKNIDIQIGAGRKFCTEADWQT